MAAQESVVEPDPRRTWDNRKLIALLAITLLAGVLRFINLSDPPELVFDETYYAKDACWYLEGSEETCFVSDEITAVHPPLGKWLISMGVASGDYTCVEEDKALCKEPSARFTEASAFAWRVVPAIAGSITVGLLFILALQLFGSLWAAVGASILLALDPLHFVQSRVAMLDIFIPMFGLGMLICLLADRRRTKREGSQFWRPWLAGAGALGGAAVASKWSGGFFVALAIALAATWAIGTRRADGLRFGAAIARALRQEIVPILLWLVLMPIAVYLLTYIGRLDGEVFAWGEGSWVQALWDRHKYMLDFHKNLEANHGYQSPAWSWIVVRRPVSYFFCSGADCMPAAPNGNYQEIFATGSPLVWWSSIIAMVSLAVAWIRRRDLRRPEGLILAGFIFTYGPWLAPLTDRSAVFIFYLLPTVPFMCLALVWVATKLGKSWEARGALAIFAVGVVSLFVWYYPLLAKGSIPEPSWRNRIWIFDNCDKPPGEATTTQVTVTEGTEVKVSSSETAGEDLPPEGWCWI